MYTKFKKISENVKNIFIVDDECFILHSLSIHSWDFFSESAVVTASVCYHTIAALKSRISYCLQTQNFQFCTIIKVNNDSVFMPMKPLICGDHIYNFTLLYIIPYWQQPEN